MGVASSDVDGVVRPWVMTALWAFLPSVSHLYHFTQTLFIHLIPPMGFFLSFTTSRFYALAWGAAVRDDAGCW